MANDFKVKFDQALPMKVKFVPDSFQCDFGPGVPIGDYEGSYEVTPTEQIQTLPTTNKTLEADVKVNAIPGNYIGSEIPRKSQTDLTAADDTVSVPSGYYAENASKAVAHGSAKSAEGTVVVNPSINVDSNGLITATVNKDLTLTPTVVPGYVSSGTSGVITASGSETEQLTTQSGSTITPTESEQTAVGAGKFTTGDVKVGAISSTYIGSDIPENDSSNLTASGATVTAPAGYYAENASKTIASGTVVPAASMTATGATLSSGTNTITLSKSVSNTPNVSTSGYISSGTSGNTDVSLTASVNTRSSSDLTASGATVTAPAGYYASSASKSVSSGSATPAASISATGAGKVVGNGTITLSKSAVSNTPQVTAGYISSGTTGNTSVSLTASVTTQGSQTLHPSTTDQTIAGNTYLTGTQTFKAVTTSNLTAENIADGVTVKIGDADDDDRIANIVGTHQGGGITPTGNINITSAGETDVTNYATATVASGTEGTPTATKGTVSNHSISVTPSVTNTAGYISGGTHNGTAVSVSASELVSNTLSITGGGTYNVTNYASASVASGTAGTPTASKGAVNNHAISVTPSVTNTTGYITGGTKTGTAVSVSAADVCSGSETKTSNGTYDVTNLAELVVNVSGGGGSKNVQVLQSTSRANSSSLTKVLGDLTVSKTGTYDIYWSGGRTNTSTSYTWGTRLYIDGTGYGTENTSWTNNCQSNHLSNVSLTANQKLSVYARGRSGSYYTFVPMLVIVES